MLKGTFNICASLELSMDSGTVALVLADTVKAIGVGTERPVLYTSMQAAQME